MTTDTTRDVTTHRVSEVRPDKVGALSAFYLALALLAAMPYFLLVVDYPGASTGAEKVGLIAEHYPSMYAMELVTMVFFGLAVGVLALALGERLHVVAPFAARCATAAGLLWAFALVASGMVFTYGMTTVEPLVDTDQGRAVAVWQAVEPVAHGLGGAGGELLGGLWVLLVSWVALRSGALPRALGWLGGLIGLVGLVSVVPPLHDVGIAFGLLEIVWFGWLGVVLLRAGAGSRAGS